MYCYRLCIDLILGYNILYTRYTCILYLNVYVYTLYTCHVCISIWQWVSKFCRPVCSLTFNNFGCMYYIIYIYFLHISCNLPNYIYFILFYFHCIMPIPKAIVPNLTFQSIFLNMPYSFRVDKVTASPFQPEVKSPVNPKTCRGCPDPCSNFYLFFSWLYPIDLSVSFLLYKYLYFYTLLLLNGLWSLIAVMY